MPKFFVEPSKVDDKTIVIDTEDVNHITRVLRMDIGSVITVCDTCGWDYEAEIVQIRNNSIICEIKNKVKSDTEPALEVTLFQALPKGSKMEYIIQKNTELGIKQIVPVCMSRCVSKIENKKDADKKVLRWQKIAESAAKQSGRGVIPKILSPISFSEALKMLTDFDLAFVPYECEENAGIKSCISGIKDNMTIGFMVGPEGGFAPKEIIKLKELNIPSVTLGKRILRTETAGETVVAVLMYEADEMN